MLSDVWNDQLSHVYRTYLDDDVARAAFDVLIDGARRLPGYNCMPSWHGVLRVFQYEDLFAAVTPTIANDLEPPRTPDDLNWRLQGMPVASKVWKPRAGDLPHAVLSRIAVGGATMARIQEVIDATVAVNGRREDTHTALALLKWAAGKKGVSFTCNNGVVTAEGMQLEPARPFEFIINRGDLRFYVRRAGRHRVGDAAWFKERFKTVEEVNGEIAINVSNGDEAVRLHHVVFEEPNRPASSPRMHGSGPEGAGSSAAIGRPYTPVGIVPKTSEREPVVVDPLLIDRGNQGHATTQDALAVYLQGHGIEPMSPVGEPDYDVAWWCATRLFVAEVKSITDANEEHQLRLGLGQLLRYRHALAERGHDVIAVLVSEREPSDPSWGSLCRTLGVVLVWPGTFDQLELDQMEIEAPTA